MLHIELLRVRGVPYPHESVRFVPEKTPENERDGAGVAELKDQAAGADAELESVRRRIVSVARVPLNADSHYQTAELVAAVPQVERRGNPFSDYGGVFGDGDGDLSAEEINCVRSES